MENRIGVPSLEIAREGNCSLIMERNTVSNHIVKIRCLNAPGWHNASIGECESCGGSNIRLETGEVIFSYVELTEGFE